jgi:hypothetical protein
MSMRWRKPPPETRNTERWNDVQLNEAGPGGYLGTDISWLNVVINEVLVFPVRLLFWIAKLLIWTFARLKSVLGGIFTRS